MPLSLAAGLVSAAMCVPAGAESLPTLAFPVDCGLGETCFLQNLVDRDAGPGRQDFTCGPASYDGHKGTDIRLATRAEIEEGVAVLAAAPGVVRSVRDGMADRRLNETPDVTNRECGNGIIIDHAEGWSTQYCHLRQGSVRVAPGERVTAAQPIGEIGLSGHTEFPHLHLTLRRGDTVIDPFTGAPMDQPCGITDAIDPMWDVMLTGALGAIMLAGFADHLPPYEAIRIDPPLPNPSTTAPAILLWMHAINLRQGDVLRLQVRAPDGSVFVTDEFILERDRAAQYRAAGRRLTSAAWQQGVWLGTTELWRNERLIDRVVQRLVVE
ncbi:MAG: M23 family metallopeptidase [Pseudomonadota bacterium]